MKTVVCYKLNKELVDNIKMVLPTYNIVEAKEHSLNKCDIFLTGELKLENEVRKFLFKNHIPVVKVSDKISADPTVLIFNNDLIEYETLYKEKIVSVMISNNRLSEMRIEEFINEKASLQFNEFPEDVTLEEIIDDLKYMSLKIEKINNCDIGHSMRVAKHAKEIARNLKFSEEEVMEVYVSALLHDIGKLKIPNNVFLNEKSHDVNKKLTMKNHPLFAYNMLHHPIYDNIKTAILFHHERCDGTGYYKLEDDKIPVISKIIAIADSYDAMISRRVHSKEMNKNAIYNELKVICEKQYDNKLVNIFIESVLN